MKGIITKLFGSLMLFNLVNTMTAQDLDSTGLPGDHFSLEGALDLFKNSESPETFEKALNSEENYVNNLDLNQDGEIDYVRVIDHLDADVHAIVLQALVAEGETQDIAVIEIEKTGNEEAILQIIGDENIYGQEMIVEPFEEDETGKGGPQSTYGDHRLIVNVWFWPGVHYLYRPAYVRWVSPWRWMSYPRWWSPWKVKPYHRMIGLRPRYHLHYHPVDIHRVGRAHHLYVPRRTTSVIVHRHYNTKVTAYRSQKGIVNTKKTTVTEGPRGGKTIIHKNQTNAVGGDKKGSPGRIHKTETKVVKRNPDGDKTVGKKTTTKVGAKRTGETQIRATKTTTSGVRKTDSGTRKVRKTTTRTVRKHQ